MIYMDNAAGSMWHPDGVERAVLDAMQHAGNPSRGAYEPALLGGRILWQCRQELAALFGIHDPNRIAFTSGATQSLNTAIKGVLHPGDHVITTAAEHNSVLRPLYEMEEAGVSVSLLPLQENGTLDYAVLPSLVKPNTRAIVITHASNVTGIVTDLKLVSDFAKKHDLLLIVDAAQTAGLIPIHAERDGIDILCFTGHKALGGPTGTGGIYVREGVEIKPLMSGGTGIHSFDKQMPAQMPTLLEAGTENIYGIAGLCAAAAYWNRNGLEGSYRHQMKLMRMLVQGMQEIPGIRLYGAAELMDTEKIVPLISFAVDGMSSAECADLLWTEGEICARAGAHCAPLVHETFGTVWDGLVRLSLGVSNTEQEVQTVIQTLRDICI